jgi:hypothetical protein
MLCKVSSRSILLHRLLLLSPMILTTGKLPLPLLLADEAALLLVLVEYAAANGIISVTREQSESDSDSLPMLRLLRLLCKEHRLLESEEHMDAADEYWYIVAVAGVVAEVAIGLLGIDDIVDIVVGRGA